MARDRVRKIAKSLVHLELQGIITDRNLAAMAGSAAREQINKNKLRTYYVLNKTFLTWSPQQTSCHDYSVCLDLLMITFFQKRNYLPKAIQLRKKRVWIWAWTHWTPGVPLSLACLMLPLGRGKAKEARTDPYSTWVEKLAHTPQSQSHREQYTPKAVLCGEESVSGAGRWPSILAVLWF